MVDVLDEDPSSALKRGLAKSVRGVKRAKNSPQDTGSEVQHSHATDRAHANAPAPADTASIVNIQLALVETVSKWMLRLRPLLFWVAVSHEHMVAQIYWQSRLVLDQYGEGGHAPEVIKGLARWLRPILPEMQADVVYSFLVRTGLHQVAKAYEDFLMRAKHMALYFTNDFGLQQQFDASIHSEMNKGLLQPGGQCLVVLPATMMPTRFQIVSKRLVLATQAPEDLEALRQQLRQ